jgi:hypothetical protein
VSERGFHEPLVFVPRASGLGLEMLHLGAVRRGLVICRSMSRHMSSTIIASA